MRTLIPLLFFVLPVISLSHCKARPSDSSRSKSNENTALAPYEVVDCNPTLCPNDVEVVQLNPDEDDLIALGTSGSRDQGFALDGDDRVKPVSGDEANKAFDRAKAASDVMGKVIVDDGKSTASKASMTGLFGSLQSLSHQTQQLNEFAKKNIKAANEAQRIKTVAVLVKMIADVEPKLPKVDNAKLQNVLDALDGLGGGDGWINRGDLPRFLPVIPNIIGKVADEKISEGYAYGISELARQKPLLYRRWVRRPNGIIGSAVQKGIDKELSKAYTLKYDAIRQASNEFQTAYNQMMDRFGVKAYYLNTDDGKNYYDPGRPVDDAQADRLSAALFGKSLSDIVRDSVASQSAPNLNMADTKFLDELVDQVELPDGIPIGDIAPLVRESEGFKKTVVPKTMFFELLPNGKLAITRATTALANQQQNQSSSTTQTPSTPQPTPSNSSGVTCKASTAYEATAERKLILYVYSSVEASKIEIETSEDYYEMPWTLGARDNWKTVKAGYVYPSWRNQKQTPLRITLTNGNKVTCTASVVHE